MEIIGGLALAGNIMNNKTKPVNKELPSFREKIPERNYDNIYGSNNKKRTRRIIENLAEKRTTASKNSKSGIIPQFYNRKKEEDKISISDSDSEFTESFDGSLSSSCDSCSLSNPSIDLNDPVSMFKAVDNFSNSKKYEDKYCKKNMNGKNTYLNQFDELKFDNPSDPVSKNAIPNMSGNHAGLKRLEIERDMELKEGFSQFDMKDDMTYGVVEKDKFVHNNMVPWFSSKTGMGYNKLGQDKLNQVNQRLVEDFTGNADSLTYRPKTERRPLFDPTIGITNLYGTPAMNDYYESRYIPSKERRNELPFTQVRETPGLNLGYNEVNKFGFTDSYRVLPKTVNELRTSNNPKVTYGGVVIPGMKGSKGQVASKVFKSKPQTFWESRPLLKGRSYITAPTIYGQFDQDNVASFNRGTSETEYRTPAKFHTDLATPDSLQAKVREGFKENYLHAEPRNFQKNEGKDARGFDESFDPKDTQRMMKNSYLGPAGVERNEKTYAYDKINNVPDSNMRNIHNEPNRVGNGLNAQQYDKGYAFDNINGINDPNMRNIHNEPNRVGQGLNNQQYDKGYAFDNVNAISDPNMRNIHNESNRVGKGLNNQQYDKSYAFDNVNAISDPNMRNIHNESNRVGQGLNNKQNDKGYLF